ncbi:HAD hydrolase family protein [uncultured Dubosiella sp.]|uniref:HAD hydrolase family protein n=1 Tax=uncultured Dubosiella sp. TaxID=1937011 RepID=UPI002730E56A|nr:HAD hydrolase family protein [uncultured Dubosiella sp.]
MKWLASDYDGTLYFEDGYKQEDLEAIRAFQKQGNMFGLCSGRRCVIYGACKARR